MENPFPRFTSPPTRPKEQSGEFPIYTEDSQTRRARGGRVELERTAGPVEHIALVAELHDYLAPEHPEACSNLYSCDPWMYEPILLDELIRERASTNDPTKLDHLRGLIRAGSWITYERVLQTDALKKIKDVMRLEDQDWQGKIRHADPDTSKELRAGLNEVRAELAIVERTIREGIYGPAAEPAVRAIENLNAHAWTDLKKILIHHGITLGEAREWPLTKPLIEEIEALRPLRDYLYFNYLYPNWVKKSPPKRAA